MIGFQSVEEILSVLLFLYVVNIGVIAMILIVVTFKSY